MCSFFKRESIFRARKFFLREGILYSSSVRNLHRKYQQFCWCCYSIYLGQLFYNLQCTTVYKICGPFIRCCLLLLPLFIGSWFLMLLLLHCCCRCCCDCCCGSWPGQHSVVPLSPCPGSNSRPHHWH